jgi:ubiquinone/menaquinone biosynthesis C-methylase UbiE
MTADAAGAHEVAVRRASQTFGAAAPGYDGPALGFWRRFGASTVERLELPRGASVLDLCCGSGESALAAARAVGPEGHVVGVDVAQPLLDLAAAKAAAEGLTNLELVQRDATATGFPDGSFDAVVCVFGVFFPPDRAGFVREMWRQVAPGGVLAVTTWGDQLFEPANGAFWDTVKEVAPELYRGFSPWDDITTAPALVGLLEAAGVQGAQAEEMPGTHELPSPEAFWDLVMGSGYRGTVDALDAQRAEQVHQGTIERLRRGDMRVVRTDVVYAAARRP